MKSKEKKQVRVHSEKPLHFASGSPIKGYIPKEDLRNLEFLSRPLSGQISFKEEKEIKDKCTPLTKAAEDPHQNMDAIIWNGNKDVKVISRPKPLITEPTDALIKITSTTICGSDLHLYHNEVPGMKAGDVLGHECMGIVENIGSEIKNLKIGDRVVVSAVIADGKCFYCKNELYSLCDNTNPSKVMEGLYGHRIAGIFGYSHTTGGYEGGQAEYIRVPFADTNTLKVPSSLSDEKVLFLSDIASTGWHANELGGVGKGSTVAIWGCGPVGLMAAMWAKFRQADKVIMIDCVDYRLQFAKEKLNVETIDFSKEGQTVKEAMDSIIPHGPDVCIDCVGFRFPKSLMHVVQRKLKLESDAPDILNEMIKCVRKGGTLSIIGDYFQNANNFAIGALMEKGLTMRGGQVYVHKYWKQLLGYIEKGLVDPSFVITHRMPLEKGADAYKLFDSHEDNVIKIILTPSATGKKKEEKEVHVTK